MAFDPLSTISRFLGRDSGKPTAADFEAAGLTLTEEGGTVLGKDGFPLGQHRDFGIAGQTFDRLTGRLYKGRFLVQRPDMPNEILLHSYWKSP